jgi:hypothetical protein
MSERSQRRAPEPANKPPNSNASHNTAGPARPSPGLAQGQTILRNSSNDEDAESDSLINHPINPTTSTQSRNPRSRSPKCTPVAAPPICRSSKPASPLAAKNVAIPYPKPNSPPIKPTRSYPPGPPPTPVKPSPRATIFVTDLPKVTANSSCSNATPSPNT